MKIAVVGVKQLPPRQGGIEQACAEMYPRMAQQGHSVDLFARSSSTQLKWFQKSHFHGVKVVSLPSFEKRGIDALTTAAFGATAASNRYDIVHFHAVGPALFSCIPRVVSPDTKIVVTCHGLDWQRAKWGRFARIWLQSGERMAVRCAHEIIVVSEALRDYFWQAHRRQTHYIPNAPAAYQASAGFDFGKTHGLIPQKYVVFLGRLVPEKCPDLLIQAFQRLRPQGWKMALIGGTSDTSGYTQSLKALAAGDPNIVLTGQLHGTQLAEIMRGAGLFVLPSYLEGMPLAMLEAMIEGIPVLASDIDPHQQLLDHHRGLLFETGSIDDCVRQMDWAIHHPAALKDMANRAQKHAQLHHSWDHITTETLKIYSRPISVPNVVTSPEQVVQP
ncbi:MAG: glycosyltransferase family 4 protein [Cyanobacteria bacterium J06633_23]